MPPAPPAPLCPRPPGVAVVVVTLPAGLTVVPVAAVVVVGAPELVDWGVTELVGEVLAVEPVLDGFVVLDAALVVFLPPRSPGCATASAMPARKTTTAATNRIDARCFRTETSSWERVTGVEPASPAWKAGALPLSYTRMHGWNVVGRT